MKLSEITKDKTLHPPSISVGDEVKVGKFKNRKAEVKGFTKDEHGQPVLKTTKGDQKLYKPRVTKLEPVNETQRELLHCFDNSWRLMMKLVKGEPDEVMDKYKLVHAMVTNVEGRTFAHGWLELEGKVIDSSRGMDDPLIMDAGEFRDVMNAENIIEYEPIEAMIKAAREKNLGPWDESLLESYKKRDYVRCPDGQRHDWKFAGGTSTERKTGRTVTDRKCENCGLTKQVFDDTGKRVNR